MKRITAVLLSLIMLLALPACQPTPEKAMAVQKNSEQMIMESEKNNEPKSTQSLSEQYGIPEVYQYQTKSGDGGLIINVDARVSVPEGNAMPIYRVKAADFTQEQVDALWNVFCKGREMWKTPQQQTKSEVQDSIAAWERFMKNEGEGDNPEAQDRLAQLQKALETAPETVEAVLADSKLEKMYFYKDPETKTQVLTSYMGLSVYEKVKSGGVTFFVQNNNDLKEGYFVENKDGTGGGGMNVSRSATIGYMDDSNPAANTNFGYSPSVPILKDSDLSDDLLINIGLKPSEAEKMVQDMLDEAHIDAVVDSVYYLDDEQKDYVGGVVRDPENYEYDIFCVRSVEGVPCANIMGWSSATDMSKAHMALWMYETMEFRVNAKGIFYMSWQSPLEITEQVNADSKLKPFSEIKEIFEKMMRIEYEAQTKNNDQKVKQTMTFEIDRVTLSLQRITEQDSYENGLLVPVWNFYGKQITSYGEDSAEQIGVSFLSINAIDGSIIDTQKGY